MPEDRKYDYGYDGDGGPDNGNDGDLSEWIPVLIFLVCFPPVGVVLLVLKLMGITGKGYNQQRKYTIMIVSTKGRYALRVMIDLSEHQSEKYVPLKEIAARQEISEKYLENILKVLVQNGFLEGLRGKGGGYRLTRSPDQYTVGEILMLTEGSLAPDP